MRAMPSRSEGRRTFVGLTVHGRLEGKPKSHLQSSPAEGLTVTKAEADRRGEAGVAPPPPAVAGGLRGESEGFGGVPPSFGTTLDSGSLEDSIYRSPYPLRRGGSRGGVATRNVRITPLDFFAWTHFLNAQLLASLV